MPPPPRFRFHTPEDLARAQAFFAGHDAAHRLFHVLLATAVSWGPFELVATKSRVALLARTRFLWCHEANDDGSIWLGFLLPQRVQSSRLRSGRAGGRWSHHTKLSSSQDLDAELLGWLRTAYVWDVQDVGDAGPGPEGKAKR